jgi:hypothetical protein
MQGLLNVMDIARKKIAEGLHHHIAVFGPTFKKNCPQQTIIGPQQYIINTRVSGALFSSAIWRRCAA